MHKLCSHSISSGHWTELSLATDSFRSPATILNALAYWLTLNGTEQVKYMDTCQGMCSSYIKYMQHLIAKFFYFNMHAIMR